MWQGMPRSVWRFSAMGSPLCEISGLPIHDGFAVSSSTARGTSDVAHSFCSEGSLLATHFLCSSRNARPPAVSCQNQRWIASASGVPGRAAAAS